MREEGSSIDIELATVNMCEKLYLRDQEMEIKIKVIELRMLMGSQPLSRLYGLSNTKFFLPPAIRTDIY